MKNNKRTGPDFQCLSCGEINKYQRGSFGKYCSNKCQMEWKWRNIDIPKVLEGNGSSRTVKRFLLEKRNKCHNCNCDPIWENKPLILQLDHLDGNSDNNKLDNVRLLCPNCHSQTPNYGYRGMNRKIKKNAKRNVYLRERLIPELDKETYNLFLGIHKSKDFTIENAYKHFAHLKFKPK